MKQAITLLISLLAFAELYSQIALPCVDSIHHSPNPYFSCYVEYDPVCGCDSQTYRNYCFAYSKAGLNYWHAGICNKDYFNIDLVPNPVQIEPAQFSIEIQTPSPATIYITDVFGATVFSRNLYTNYPYEINTFEIDMNGFLNGVYVLIAVVQGEKKFIKFIKVKY